MKKRIPLFAELLAVSSIFLWPFSVHGIGPRNVTSGGLPVKWSSMPVTVDVESRLSRHPGECLDRQKFPFRVNRGHVQRAKHFG